MPKAKQETAAVELTPEQIEAQRAAEAEKAAKSAREAAIALIIEQVPKSCSFDMDKMAIFGRTFSRLVSWGMDEEEVGQYSKAIMQSVDAHMKVRNAAAMERAQIAQARQAKRIQDAIG